MVMMYSRHRRNANSHILSIAPKMPILCDFIHCVVSRRYSPFSTICVVTYAHCYYYYYRRHFVSKMHVHYVARGVDRAAGIGRVVVFMRLCDANSVIWWTRQFYSDSIQSSFRLLLFVIYGRPRSALGSTMGWVMSRRRYAHTFRFFLSFTSNGSLDYLF